MLIDQAYWQSSYIPADVLAAQAGDPFLRQLVVCKVGYFPVARGHAMERTGIDEHILIHCLAGAGWVEVAGQRLAIGPGDLAWCPAGVAHAYAAGQVEPWTIRWIHFRGEGCADLLGRVGFSVQDPVRHIGLAPSRSMALAACCRILDGGYSYSLLLQASLTLTGFLAALLAGDGLNDPGTGPGAAGRGELDGFAVIQLMRTRLDQALSLDQLAALAGYSRYHFCRAFHRQTGYPPMEYFTRLKIQRAGELLETTLLSSRSISEALAFSTPYYFSTVFKRITGWPPSEYRLQHREQAML